MASENYSQDVALPEYYHGKKDVLNNIVDYMAKKHPQALFAEFPVSSTSYDTGYRKINYEDLANAINGAAWWLHESLGGPGKYFETLAYIGINDPRYNIMVLAAVKAGYKLFLSSPRNSIAAHSHLLKSLDCKTLITPDPKSPLMAGVLASHPLNVLKVPGIHELLDRKSRRYPYTKTFEEAKNEPLVALHTSGSTGMPKPIIWTHEWAAAYYNMIQLDPPKEYESQDRLFQGNRVFFLFPPFHAAALLISLISGIANRTAWIYPLSGALPSGKLVVDGLKHTKADVLAIPPPLVVDIAKQPEMVDFVASSVDTLIYGGGDLPEAIGAALTGKLKLVSVYGASEIGLPPAVRLAGKFPSEDWQYVHFHPRIGAEFRHVNEDLFELRFVRYPELEEHQPVFKLFPELQVYDTRDLYTPHPTKPDLWMYKGRSDDIIVFLTGEKTNPTSFEHHLSTHSDVKAALVVGAQRFQAALLIELLDDKELTVAEKADVIERIWPTIHEANQICPAHAKVAKTHVLLVDPKKPMARAGKGTVQRQVTITTYAEELDALYTEAEKMNPVGNESAESLAEPLTFDILSSLIERLMKKETGWANIGHEDNFFLLGVDSLQILLLIRNIRQATGIYEIAPSTVYANPSISELSRAILDTSTKQQASLENLKEIRKHAINEVIVQHSKSIDALAASQDIREMKIASGDTDGPGHVVILTGSTGSLGSYLLQSLLQNQSVAHIYCLNRSRDSAAIQTERNKSRGLPSDFPIERVTFLSAQLNQEYFGLEPVLYDGLLRKTTKVIINGWNVNFNVPLSSFQQQLESIVNFSKFAHQSRKSPSILFISSISSIKGLDGIEPILPESIIFDHSAPLPMGYGESKYIAERLLHYAAEKLFLNAHIARVGQIAGPIHSPGIWNKREWLPSLVISSLHIGALPKTLGASIDKIDWVPIDVLADVLVELVISAQCGANEGGASVYHPHNPNTTSWTELLPTISETLRAYRAVPVVIVPFEDWLKRIQADAESSIVALDEGLTVNPAIKLLDFYEGLCRSEDVSEMASGRAQQASSELRSCGAVRPEWVEKWCRGWLEDL